MKRAPTVLAVASAGGHLVQLLRLMASWEECQTVIVTTDDTYKTEVEMVALTQGQIPPLFEVVSDANRWQKFRLIRATLDIVMVLLRHRPDVVITTGAAPGYIALRLGSLIGARTVWIDSIANSDELSLSGQMAGKHADLWLTQWAHLARPTGPHYRGSVL